MLLVSMSRFFFFSFSRLLFGDDDDHRLLLSLSKLADIIYSSIGASKGSEKEEVEAITTTKQSGKCVTTSLLAISLFALYLL